MRRDRDRADQGPEHREGMGDMGDMGDSGWWPGHRPGQGLTRAAPRL